MTIKDNTACKSLSSFVSSSLDNALQFQNSSYYDVIDGVIMEDYNIFRDTYFAKLMEYTETYEMSDADFKLFKFRPKRLSARLYRTIDYWYILLIINKMSSIMQFTRKKIKVLSYDGVAYVKYIMQKEEDEIAENKTKVNVDYATYLKENS